MIKPAQLYECELKQLYYSVFNNPEYMYYFGCWGTSELLIPHDNYDSHHFAILGTNNEIIGYICYAINYASKVANNFGIISFKKSIIFGRDLKKIIDDIFNVYNTDKIEFRAFADNPVMRHYQKFIKEHGGREVGVLHNSVMLSDRKLHDDVMFELFKINYNYAKTCLKSIKYLKGFGE